MRGGPPIVRLESFGRGDGERSYTFSGFVEVIRADSLAEVVSSLSGVEKAVDGGLHAAGFVCYEAAPAFDPALRVQPPAAGLPLVWFALYRHREPIVPTTEVMAHASIDWVPSIKRETYAAGVDRIREYIRAGDTYQVNFTHRLRATSVTDPCRLHRQLCHVQRASYAAYIDTGRHQIVSASPELFFRVRDGRIVTRPMKGTRLRGLTSSEDDRLAEELAVSEKERAENLMIVDLVRNDLGRVCEPGSIRVNDLWSVERYETVLQMTSEVEGRLRLDAGLTDVMGALFPCGSVTGAPKVRTMEIIRDLECSPRGVYTGAIGFVSPGGEATFSVGIRTVCVDTESGKAEYGVGGGITFDSSSEREYAECVTKARVLTERRPDFSLFETMRYDPGDGVYLLERHVERISRSARYFRFPFERERFDRVVMAEVDGSEEPLRIRVTLDRAGELSCERQSMPVEKPMTAIVSEVPVDSRDPFLYHKTTHRAVYEAQHERYRDVADAVILVNERGEVVECLVGNVVVQIENRCFTPPVSSGLLAGTFPDELLCRGEIEERTLMRPDIYEADSVFMINSIREWVPLTVITPDEDDRASDPSNALQVSGGETATPEAVRS